jgi:hypothetical protein
MRMLGNVLTRLLAKVTSLTLTVQAFLTKKLSELLGVLTNLKTQFAVLQLQFSQLVLQLQKVKLLLVPFITLAVSTKVALISVLRNLGVLGKQLATTARQILQLVTQLFSKGK